MARSASAKCVPMPSTRGLHRPLTPTGPPTPPPAAPIRTRRRHAAATGGGAGAAAGEQ